MTTKNTEVRIKSKKQFTLTVANAYTPKMVAIPGTVQRHRVSDPADVDKYNLPVYIQHIPISDNFEDFFFEGVIARKKGYVFKEDPYINDESPEARDPCKKLNHHFKEFNVGDPVPLEYMFLRAIYNSSYQFSQGYLQIKVTKDNFTVVQWALQALYNDLQEDYCPIAKSVLNGAYANLIGERHLVSMPTKVVNTIIGEYNVYESNQEAIEKHVAKLEKELEDKKQWLDQAKNLKKNFNKEYTPNETPAEGEPEAPPAEDPLANAMGDAMDPAAILQQAIDSDIVQVSGTWFKFQETTLGQGYEKALDKVRNDAMLLGEIQTAVHGAGVPVAA